MSELGLNNDASLQYWGSIEGAVRTGANTAQVWDAIRSHQDALGDSAPAIDIRDVSRMRTRAAEIRESSRQLASTDPIGPVLGNYMAVAPWARDLADRNTLAIYQVRFEHTFEDEGQVTSQYRTVTFQGQLPPTVQDLYDQVDNDAEAMADEYGTAHQGIGNISILAI